MLARELNTERGDSQHGLNQSVVWESLALIKVSARRGGAIGEGMGDGGIGGRRLAFAGPWALIFHHPSHHFRIMDEMAWRPRRPTCGERVTPGTSVNCLNGRRRMLDLHSWISVRNRTEEEALGCVWTETTV